MRFLRLGAAGMRGEIASGMNPQLAINYASALGTYLEGGKILIGRDTRISSEMLSYSVLSALQSCGCEIIDTGICSAPELHFMVPHLKADGAILIGAGHHPANWNALVPLNSDGAYFNSIQSQNLLDIYHSRKFIEKNWKGIGEIKSSEPDQNRKYLKRLCSNFDINAIASKKFRVVSDLCNGSGSSLISEFADILGIELIAINDTPSGILPHSPEPRPRSANQVRSIMKPLNADVGFVYNSDMSRVSIVTDSSETLSEEYSFPLIADHMLNGTSENKKIVTNWCTTKTLDKIVERHGGTIHKAKVGQAYLIDRMLELNALMSGDGSGSAALANSVSGFDSFMMTACILEAMAVKKCSSSALAENLPKYHIVKRKIPCPSAHAYSLIRSIPGNFKNAEITERDGLRIDWPDGWVHLRASNTEPIIRMMVEWKTQEEAKDVAVHVRGLMERLVSE